MILFLIPVEAVTVLYTYNYRHSNTVTCVFNCQFYKARQQLSTNRKCLQEQKKASNHALEMQSLEAWGLGLSSDHDAGYSNICSV